MEMYTGAEHRATETYMIPDTGSNPHPTFLPQLEEIGYMGNEMAPEFIVDQGMYYPAANYYGYYTGFETPSEWDDHNQFLGLDGQDVHYSGLQTESLPYAYYTPSYAQSPYNPYNPYIPGAIIGVDGPYAGTQQYFTSPPYQPSAYIPVVVQPGTDAVQPSILDPSLFSTDAPMASAHVNSGVKYAPSLSSGFVGANSQKSASGTSQSSQNTAKSSQASLVNAPPSRQSSLQGAMSLGSAAHLTQVRNSSGLAQTAHQFSHGRVPSVQDPIKVTVSSTNGFTQFGSNGRGWATPDKLRPRSQFNGVVANPTGGTDVLGEQNKGPRTGRLKGQWTSAIVNGAHTGKVGASNVQQSITISADQYNRDDFPVDYSNAKFFVIKSYSEDDVHKSIKYNVWSSTPNGNKKLCSAYEDAQRISAGKPRNCPIFLFFSVNASGQFCGVSEMVGPVDFEKDMDFWQQDKWTGSFPVKWHIIKDVPNMSFRHIILENNENKPVTNSRDTQEIWYLPGMNMLNIYKGSPLKTSILDDFMFYEERERIMQEEKSRILGRSYDSSHFLTAVVPVQKTGVTVVQTPKSGEQSNGSIAVGKQPDGASDQPSVAAGKQPDGSINQPTKANGKRPNGTVDQPPKAAGKLPNGAVDQPPKAAGKPLNGTIDQFPKAAGKLPNGAVDQPPKAAGKPPNGTVNQPPKAARKLPNDIVDQPPKAAGKPPNGAVDQPLKAVGKLPNGAEDQPPKGDGKPLNGTVDQPPIAGGKPLDRPVDQPPKAVIVPSKPKDPKSMVDQPPGAGRSPSKLKDPKSMGDHHPRADKNPGKPKDLKSSTIKAGTCEEQVTHKFGSINSSYDKSNPKSDPTGESSGANSVSRIGLCSIDLKEGEAEASTSTDVVTVGSMRIKVKGFGESSSSSGILTVGAIPFEPKGLKLGKQGTSAGGRPHEK